MHCSYEIQLKVIAVVETVVSVFFLGLNFRILVQLMLGHLEREQLEHKAKYNLSESALIMYFLIRVIYLLGELLLAVFLNYNVYKRNINGLILWFFMTIIFSIPSRCYFIGGILWGQYFVATLLIFSINLAFTAYSLVIICLHVKNLSTTSPVRGINDSSSSRRGSITANEFTDTYLDFL